MGKKGNHIFSRSSSLRVVIIYVLVGTLWIFFSDKLLLFFTSDMDTYLILQTYKGTFYVISTAVMLYFLIRNEFRFRDRIERQLNTALQQQEELTRELHHRVKNNLQLVRSILNLQRRALVSKNTELNSFDLMRQISIRLQAISLFHEKIYIDGKVDRIPLNDYLLEITRQHYREFEEELKGKQVNLDLKKVLIPVTAAVPIGFIYNELIMNAVQHAFSRDSKEPVISVGLARPGNELELTVHDNGRLFSTDENKNGLGYTLIQSMLGQLNGSITVEKAEGMRITVSIPFDSLEGKPAEIKHYPDSVDRQSV